MWPSSNTLKQHQQIKSECTKEESADWIQEMPTTIWVCNQPVVGDYQWSERACSCHLHECRHCTARSQLFSLCLVCYTAHDNQHYTYGFFIQHLSIWNTPNTSCVPEKMKLKLLPHNFRASIFVFMFWWYLLRQCLVIEFTNTTYFFQSQRLSYLFFWFLSVF